MKVLQNFVLVLCFGLIAVSQASAQTDKGSVLLRGGSNVNFSSGKGQLSSLNVDLAGGYFVVNNLDVTLGLGVNWIEDFGTNFSITPGVEYFVLGKIPVGAGLDMWIPTSDGASTEFGVYAKAGYNLMLNDHIGLEPGVRFGFGLSDGYPDLTYNIGLAINAFLYDAE